MSNFAVDANNRATMWEKAHGALQAKYDDLGEGYHRLMIDFQELSRDYHSKENWLADQINQIFPWQSCSSCEVDNPEDGSTHWDHFFARASAVFAADDKRCDECNSELSACGEFNGDEPSMDCECCQLRSEVNRLQVELQYQTDRANDSLTRRATDTEVAYARLRRDYDELKAETNRQKTEAKCGVCQGTGILRDRDRPEHAYFEPKCPNCYGTGRKP